MRQLGRLREHFDEFHQPRARRVPHLLVAVGERGGERGAGAVGHHLGERDHGGPPYRGVRVREIRREVGQPRLPFGEFQNLQNPR